ncbi:AAA family ATPase [Halorhabdus amylolytica]|uniref:AAA family ATPase n=1 Tax=Halorhabdus amylolytica TaxID=2559573 RepID=UPI0010AA99BF|nr:AAA family ATPase [Halorhabdus amylolytica]
MKLQSVEIVNFRPYRDSHLDLTDRDGSIHVVEGDQGGGKTSLHTAIQWGLYGGDGPGTNYSEHWNERAKQDREEKMSVEIKFKEGERSYTLIREIDRFNHTQGRAYEETTLIGNTNTYSDEEAQNQIEEILPEQLKEFFFLDGERIQRLIEEDAGQQVKREIETVLKHRTIINAQNDLEDLLEDRLIPRRDKIEEEASERDEIVQEISEYRDDIKDLKEQNEDDRDKIQEKNKILEETREELEELNEEKIEEINDLEAEIQVLQQDKVKILSELNQSWKELRYAILFDDVADLKQELKRQIKEYDEQLSEIERNQIIYELTEEAREGECPICGNDDIEYLKQHDHEDHDENLKEQITERIVELREMRDRLDSVEPPEDAPGDKQVRLEEITSKIEEKQDRRDELLDELGGLPEESERDTLEQNIKQLENDIRDLREDIEDREKKIQKIQQEIKKLENKREERSSNKDLEEVTDKIGAAKTAIEKLKTIREKHVREKRKKIRDEMNEVFDQVAQSEFMNERYKGLDFRGTPDEDDSYVLQLVEVDGETKDMVNHQPSAGESQLTALSFIFGLNKYARYSSTVVFDTVAGRLDLTNSEAQGEFFASLDEPLLLLVTDSELRDLGKSVQQEIGAHYEIKPEGKDSKLKKVK